MAIGNECSADGEAGVLGGLHAVCLGYGGVLTGWLRLALVISESLSWAGEGDWFILWLGHQFVD